MLFRMTNAGGDTAEDEFARYEFVNGTKVQNSERESDGSFRRMATSPKGLDFTLWNGVPADQMGHIAELLDSVAVVSYDAGAADKAAEVRKVLGVKS